MAPSDSNDGEPYGSNTHKFDEKQVASQGTPVSRTCINTRTFTCVNYINVILRKWNLNAFEAAHHSFSSYLLMFCKLGTLKLNQLNILLVIELVMNILDISS